MISPRKIAGLIGIFALSAIASSVAISRGVLPDSKDGKFLRGQAGKAWDVENQMLDWVEGHPGERYVLFFGPSTTERMIDPRVFDHRMMELGHRVTSFNLGLRGSCLHEVDYYVRRAIERIEQRGLTRPEWIAIDLSLSGTAYQLADTPENVDGILSKRSEEWHDLYQTKAVATSILRAPEPSRGLKVQSLDLHLRVAARRFFNRRLWRRPPILGLAHRVWEEAQDRREDDELEADGTDERGYTGLEGEGVEHMRARFLASFPDGYETLIEAKIRELDGPGVDLGTLNPEAMKALDAFLGRGRISRVYVVAPMFPDTRHAHAFYAAGIIPTLLAYDDPRRFPEFFTLDSRFEEYHLKPRAADHYTERLASDMLHLFVPTTPGPSHREAATPYFPLFCRSA